MGVVGSVALCLSGLFLQAWTEPSLERGQKPDPINSETHSISKPMLGIVLPLLAEEMADAVESLRHWPKKCTETTLSRMDVIFYFAGGIPNHFDIKVGEITESLSCFKTTKAVSSALNSEVRHVVALLCMWLDFYMAFFCFEPRIPTLLESKWFHTKQEKRSCGPNIRFAFIFHLWSGVSCIFRSKVPNLMSKLILRTTWRGFRSYLFTIPFPLAVCSPKVWRSYILHEQKN